MPTLLPRSDAGYFKAASAVYVLNIKGVQQEIPAPAGGTKLIFVMRGS
jgi:hypothetical protein